MSEQGFPEANEVSTRVLAMFQEMGKDTLDLHELFEAGGNDPEERTAVFDAVERLVAEGYLDERGNDFYALTDKGRLLARSKSAEDLQ